MPAPAPLASPETANAPEQQTASDFLENFSIEILPRHLPLLETTIAPRLRPGRRVYIALVDPSEIPAQVATATALRRLGLEPVPHLPARFMGNPPDLDFHLQRLTQESGVSEILALGGGAPKPYGAFHSVMEMLQTGFFHKHDIRRLGFAGHVEGNRDIVKSADPAPLFDILRAKADFAAEADMQSWVVTQFAFDMKAVAAWTTAARNAGITLPIRVGFAGPAKPKTLLRYALMCGVGPSIRVLRKQTMSVQRLLTTTTPDDVIDDLSARMRADTEKQLSQIIAPHFFPLGGVEATLDWLRARLQRDFPL